MVDRIELNIFNDTELVPNDHLAIIQLYFAHALTRYFSV